MLSTVVLRSTAASSTSAASLSAAAHHFSRQAANQSSSSFLTINIGQFFSYNNVEYEVIETAPFACRGKVSESTEWIVLPSSATFPNDREADDSEIISKLKEYYECACANSGEEEKMQLSQQQDEPDHQHDDGGDDATGTRQFFVEPTPIFVLGDYLNSSSSSRRARRGIFQAQDDDEPTTKTCSDTPGTLNVLNSSSLLSILPFILSASCYDTSERSRGEQQQQQQQQRRRKQNKKLAPIILRLIARITQKLSLPSSASNQQRKQQQPRQQSRLIVTPTTLQALQLRHHSVITLRQETRCDDDDEDNNNNNNNNNNDHDLGDEGEEGDGKNHSNNNNNNNNNGSTSSNRATRFTLEMVFDEEFSDLLDAFCGALSLVLSSSSSSCGGKVFAFLPSSQLFSNLKLRIFSGYENYNSTQVQNESSFNVKSLLTQTSLKNIFILENLTVIPEPPSAQVVAATASSVILRPLTRNIVTEPIDTSRLLHLRRESDLISSPSSSENLIRKGDVISVEKRRDADDVTEFASPLSLTFDNLARPMNPVSSFCPQTQNSIFFYVESVKVGGKNKNENLETSSYVSVSKSTAIIEGAPLSSNKLFLPSVPSPSSTTITTTTLLPHSSVAFSRTKTYRYILETCHRLFVADSSSSSASCSFFKLFVLNASSPKVASLPQLQLALSAVGIYFEVILPNLIGVENLKSVANLVCNATTSTGVLVLYCADSTLFEHSEVVQWLVAASKQSYPLRVILVTESGDSSSAALSLLNTVASVPAVNLDEVAAQECERKVFLEDLIFSLSQNCRYFSKFINIAAVAEATAGLFFFELYQLVLQSISRSSCSSTTLPPLTVDQEYLINQLELFKKQHGHNVTSTKLQEVHWNDIGGLEGQREEIMTVLRPPAYLAGSNAKRRTGVLLFGPPGCGKTLLAKAVATECGMNFLSVKGPELLNMYVGQSEKNIRDVFKKAREAAPCIVFFDELDALAPARGAKGDSGGVMDRIVAQLLVELDGAVAAAGSSSSSRSSRRRGKSSQDHHQQQRDDDADDNDDDDDDDDASEHDENEQVQSGDAQNPTSSSASSSSSSSNYSAANKKMVFIIGATNRPDLLDPSLLRPGRFDRMSYVGLAETKQDQLAAVRALTRKFRMADDISFESGNLEKFLNVENVQCIYTGADYYGFCADAMTLAVSEAVSKFQASLSVMASPSAKDDDDPAAFVVTRKHFEDALKNLSPSVPMSELNKYQQLRKQYAVQK